MCMCVCVCARVYLYVHVYVLVCVGILPFSQKDLSTECLTLLLLRLLISLCCVRMFTRVCVYVCVWSVRVSLSIITTSTTCGSRQCVEFVCRPCALPVGSHFGVL